VLREVTAGRTAAPVPQQPTRGKLARGGGGTAARALSSLGAVMSFAVARGFRDNNPVHGVKKPPTRRMERFLVTTLTPHTEADTAALCVWR
jgi:hypothetical protein